MVGGVFFLFNTVCCFCCDTTVGSCGCSQFFGLFLLLLLWSWKSQSSLKRIPEEFLNGRGSCEEIFCANELSLARNCATDLQFLDGFLMINASLNIALLDFIKMANRVQLIPVKVMKSMYKKKQQKVNKNTNNSTKTRRITRKKTTQPKKTPQNNQKIAQTQLTPVFWGEKSL